VDYVYVLLSLKDKKFYTGITSDLRRRLEEHNTGKCFSTAPRRPFKIIYYEAYIYRQDAESREKYLKTNIGRRTLKKQLKYLIESLRVS
jgi:putative endonuclease